MSQVYSVNGNIQFPPAPDAANTTVPISQQIGFTQLIAEQLVYSAPVTAQAINLGTLTNPKSVYIEVISGSCVLKMNTGDTGTIPLAISATPLPTDRSSFALSNPNGLGALAMVITVAANCTLKLYAVQ